MGQVRLTLGQQSACMYTWRLHCRPPFPAFLGGYGAGQSHLILQLWGGAHCEETEAPKAEPLTPGSSALVKGKELLLSGLGQRQDFPAALSLSPRKPGSFHSLHEPWHLMPRLLPSLPRVTGASLRPLGQNEAIRPKSISCTQT